MKLWGQILVFAVFVVLIRLIILNDAPTDELLGNNLDISENLDISSDGTIEDSLLFNHIQPQRSVDSPNSMLVSKLSRESEWGHTESALRVSIAPDIPVKENGPASYGSQLEAQNISRIYQNKFSSHQRISSIKSSPLSKKKRSSNPENCVELKHIQEEKWAIARAATYVTHSYNDTASLPPVWSHSSVITGPDFPCEDLVRVDQGSKKDNRPSWGACALRCGDAQCSRARHKCVTMSKCRGVAVLTDDKYRGLAVLKGDYVWTGMKAGLSGNLNKCMGLQRDARRGTLRKSVDARMSWISLGCQDYARPHWDAVFSASTKSSTTSEWGGLEESLFVASKPCRSCPLHLSARPLKVEHGKPMPLYSDILGVIHVIVVTDRPSTSLCAFTNSALWSGVTFTILGWDPSSPPRWQEWYLGSKPMMIAEYIGKCRLESDGQQGFSPESTVLVTDSDVLINTTPEALISALESYAANIQKGEIVFSAEGPCVTVNQKYRKHLCSSFQTRAETAGASAGGLTSLNSGLWAGQAKSMRQLARRFYQASRKYLSLIKTSQPIETVKSVMMEAMRVGDEVSSQIDAGLGVVSISPTAEAAHLMTSLKEVKERNGVTSDDFDDFSQVMNIRSKYKSELESLQGPMLSFSGTAFLVNDQSVYYLMMMVEDTAVHRIVLDYDAKLFLNMYGSPNRLNLEINPKLHQLENKGAVGKSTNTPLVPVFVHYNGGSKLSKWNVKVSRDALIAHRLAQWRSTAHLEKGDSTLSRKERAEMSKLFDRHVLVVDNHFHTASVNYGDICPS